MKTIQTATFNKSLRWGRLLWCLFVTWYFINFSYNFFSSVIPDRDQIPIIFFILLILWMVIEYYFESPYFQSGLVSYSNIIKTFISFFFYLNGSYAIADYTFGHRTQLIKLYPFLNVFGLLLFSYGTFVRLNTLFELLFSKDKLYFNRNCYRYCRHPRLWGTFVQFLAIPMVFGSYPGIILSSTLGLFLIYRQAQLEENFFLKEYKEQYQAYQLQTPFFIPFFRKKAI
ncbi:MAG: methyltransferase [candidate division WOR-3 bacterium]